MIFLLIAFAKICIFLKVTKKSNNEYEFESEFSFDNINESVQKFQSFITTSQFSLDSNEYIFSAFPRSTDIISLSTINASCDIPLFILGDIQKEPSLSPQGLLLTITNIVYFSYAPLNEL